MDDSAQQQLFAETPGSIEPPEERLYLGTSGWSYADWEGTVYPPGTTPASRLAEYVKHFATVEIDSTFCGAPTRRTVERWRTVAPRGFLFAAKFPQAVTHETNLVGSEAGAERFVRTMADLGDKLGPPLLQLPPSFGVEGIGVLEDFFKRLTGGSSLRGTPTRRRSATRICGGGRASLEGSSKKAGPSFSTPTTTTRTTRPPRLSGSWS